MRFFTETLGLAGVVAQAGLVWHYWSALPARIPTHYGLNGQPNSYGDRWSVWILPGVTIMLYALLTAISFFPQLFNYPVEVTDENRGRLEAIGVALIGWIKAEIAWIFVGISWMTIRVSLGLSSGMSLIFLPVILILVGITVAIGIVQMRRSA